MTKELNHKGHKEHKGLLGWKIKPLTQLIAFVLFVAFVIQPLCALCGLCDLISPANRELLPSAGHLACHVNSRLNFHNMSDKKAGKYIDKSEWIYHNAN